MRDLGRFLILAGAVLLIVGIAVTVSGRLALGKLPGDIVVKRDNFTFYFPLMTSIIVSVVLSLLFWLFRR